MTYKWLTRTLTEYHKPESDWALHKTASSDISYDEPQLWVIENEKQVMSEIMISLLFLRWDERRSGGEEALIDFS